MEFITFVLLAGIAVSTHHIIFQQYIHKQTIESKEDLS